MSKVVGMEVGMKEVGPRLLFVVEGQGGSSFGNENATRVRTTNNRTTVEAEKLTV